MRELEITLDELRVRVSKDGGVTAAPGATPTATAPVGAAEVPAQTADAITAPLTGVFYRSASPQSPPLVQVGSVVAPGDVIGLIEAMKLFNEIRAARGGRVSRILAENGQLVRAHQPLVELEPQ